MTSASNRVGLLLTFLALGCSAAQKLGHDKPNANSFAWVVGDWEGYRIDGESGSRSPLSSKIIFILGGAAVCEDLTVGGGAAPYCGFYVQGPGPTQGQWQMHYISAGRKSALYKGAFTDSSAEWFQQKFRPPGNPDYIMSGLQMTRGGERCSSQMIWGKHGKSFGVMKCIDLTAGGNDSASPA